MTNIPFSIEATLDRFDGESGVLRTNDGQELQWPAAEIPDDVEEGSTVHLALITDEAMGGSHQVMAQDILNEILSGEGDV